MTDGKFEMGDVVYLKSGSPKMTVTCVIANTAVRCVWVVFGTGELKSADLPHDALKLAQEKRVYGRYEDEVPYDPRDREFNI
jgi:uncharacterized protein YodC (DUF2158 family)